MVMILLVLPPVLSHLLSPPQQDTITWLDCYNVAKEICAMWKNFKLFLEPHFREHKFCLEFAEENCKQNYS